MKKVLIAEDDPFIRDLAIAELTAKGFSVEITADGNSVIPRLLDAPVDILLLDLQLPNKLGFEILKEIRLQPGLVSLPVIIFSNEIGTDVEEKAVQYNASYFFKALTGTGELVTKIEEILQ
jgi:DNA-binding response OmpR family regulator